jgi:MFS family permease
MNPAEASADYLLTQIATKRTQVDRFVAAAAPRKRRLVNLAIVAGTLAAALTTGPALGGQTFTAWLTKSFGLASPAWQLLCGGAAICSVSATVATQLLKSQNVEEHVARAHSCRAKLDVLEIGLKTGQIDVPRATSEYMRCLEESAPLNL